MQNDQIQFRLCQIDINSRRMTNVTLKWITVQLCKEIKIKKVKKSQKIIENYEEKVGEIDR